MNFEENLSAFKCAMASDEHFAVEKPVTLLCSHACCLSCIEMNKTKDYKIKCNLCNKESKIDYDVISESFFVKHFISLNCGKIFHAIRNKYEDSLKNLKVKISSMTENLNGQIEYFKDEIETKVESMKQEIEGLRISLINQLDEVKKEFQEYTKKIDLEKYEQCLKNANKKQEINEKKLDELQNELKSLNMTMDCVKEISPNVSFVFNSEKLTENLVGSLDYNFRNILQTIHVQNETVADLSHNPYGLCVLPDNNLLLAYPVQRFLSLHNPHLSFIRQIDLIDYHLIQPRYLTTNDKTRIYIAQSDHHKITVTDLDFRLIREIGSKGDGVNQFNYPLGIFWYQGSVFVCDCENKRIQKFTENLVYQESYSFDFKPLSLRVINNFACIRSNSEDFVYFYSLNPLRLINKLNIFGHSAIFSTNFWFYVFDSVPKELNSYDVMGNKVYSFSLDFQPDITPNEKISFELKNHNLIISCRLAKKLILFS